ncbi:DnaB helicase C-terminal domain-containing protein [[Brevibacterium] frigoritolerans]|nr:DnaB helicase C-terminal domain-containing protein [Peribacillus frigoritolerans]
MSVTQQVVKQENQFTIRRRENIILSSILFDKDCRESAIQKNIESDPFQDKRIKKIIDIFNGLCRSNIPPRLDIIVEQYFPKDEDEPKRTQLLQDLMKLRDSCPPADVDLFKQHLFFLKKHKGLDKLRKLLNQGIALIEKEEQNPSYDKETKTFDYLSSEFEELVKDFTLEEAKMLNLSEGLTGLVQRIRNQKKNPTISETVTTGYDALDETLSGGFRKGNYTLVCARPAMGKTVVMLNFAIEAAKKGLKVLFLSIEMDLTQCLQRVLSKVSSVKLKNILQPEHMADPEIEELDTAAKEASQFYGKNLFIEEVSSINAPQLEAKIKFYQKQFGVDLVFVDYIQIMRTRKNTTPSKTSDYEEISYDLRELAKGTKVALVLGAQLNRDLESRDDKRPIDSDLKNTGSFEQDAAALIHLYRDAVYNKETEDKNILEVIIGKNRFGPGNITHKMPIDYSRQSVYQMALPTAA